MKRLLTIVALICAVAFQAHAQFDIEVIKKDSSIAERQAHAGEDIIVVNDRTSEFRRLTKEEGQQCRLEFKYKFNSTSRDIEVDPNSGSVMYFPPQTYNEIVRRYLEFKNKK